MPLEGLDGGGGQPEVPDLDDGCVVVLGGEAELRGHVGMPRADPGAHARGRVAQLDDGVVLAQVPHDAARREGRRQDVLHLPVDEDERLVTKNEP